MPRQNKKYVYFIGWLIFNKPQPNLYSGDTCVGPTGEERFR